MEMMDLDFPGDPLCVKLEPSESGMVSVSPCSSSLMNGSGKPLSEFNSDSDSSPGKTYQCDGGDLNCIASSPDSIENKHDYCSSTLSLEQDGISETPKRLCLVCGDVASGYHYGVASCEACKAFFKRTIQGNIEYSCPANNLCEITKRRRKACQACRFQKCLRMGMLKEGVRLDRVRGGRQKYKRSPDAPPTPITQHALLPKRACIEGPVNGGNLSPSPASPTDAFLFPSPQSEPVSLWLGPGRLATFQQPKPSSKNKMLSALLSIEPEKVYALPDTSLPDDEFKFMCTLTDLSDRELVATIGWAKQVPGFINLPLGDQMNLLQSTWLDILCFNLAYRSTPYKGILVFADDFQCLDEDSIKYQIPPALDQVARKIAGKLTDLRMTREEYVFIKAILLLNPDVSMENPETVQQLRDRMQESLLEYERSIGSQPHRVGNLLLCLPFIMQEKMLAVQYWAQVKKDGRVPLHKLLSEMLEFAIT